MKRTPFSIETSTGKGHSLRILSYRKSVLAAAFTLILILFMSHGAAAQQDDDKYHFTITPYLWLPSIDGSVSYTVQPRAAIAGLARTDVEVDADDILDALDFAFMVSGEVRRSKWSLFTDLIYLDLSAENSDVKSVQFLGGTPLAVGVGTDAGTDASLEGIQWTLAGGYSLVQGKYALLDIFGGFRYFGVEASTDWTLTVNINGPLGGQVFNRTGSISQSEDIWDGIVGARGRINLGDSNWFLPYYLDLGIGDSDFTWQGLLGVAYTIKWVDIKLAYRHLYYDTGGDKLLDDFSLSGPIFGASFRF
jgi:hypothetical protein